MLQQKIRPEFAVADPNDEIFFGQSERAQNVDAKGDQLDVGGEIALAHDVAVQLVMFPQSAALLFFVTKELTDGKPLERFLERALVSGDHARQCRRELGPHRHFAVALVGKIEQLIDDFGAAFFAIEISRLEKWTVPFHESIAPGYFAPAREGVVPRRTVARQKISKTWEWLHHFKNQAALWPRTICAVE